MFFLLITNWERVRRLIQFFTSLSWFFLRTGVAVPQAHKKHNMFNTKARISKIPSFYLCLWKRRLIAVKHPVLGHARQLQDL